MKQDAIKNDKNISEYAIGVVTYVARFEEFFIPLIKRLVEVFPDKEIICVINGHHDTSLQIDYLKRVTVFLNQFPNVHYITHEKHQPLAKCFNWLALMAFAPRILILNDDVSLNLLFRHDFEKELKNNDSFFVINRSWCHFLISKKYMKEIGWFDERLLGTGYEDGDYHIRIEEKDRPVTKVDCRGLINYVAAQDNVGWANISEKVKIKGDKSATVNYDFFYSKYSSEGKLQSGMETPVFYELSLLDDKTYKPYLSEFDYKDKKPAFFRVIMLPFNMVYSYTRKTMIRICRCIKKCSNKIL